MRSRIVAARARVAAGLELLGGVVPTTLAVLVRVPAATVFASTRRDGLTGLP
ncbi:hypothetical protein Q5425_34745 [Amycolatopsis sp. A133]|uniref:hypothetical protein n=1 Tax=Amycolatopsis sp. A133 TaxID=3064472 RepID=UPI0027E8ED8D|nr:hypothetical protein [Amycolatopsis sp. A133]MDQ7808924.1 hypothetical protein [Amycolatopsis sp. A133]